MIRENRLYCLCRCMKREFAEDMFYNGNLYFNYPITWINEAKKGNVGQGDLYEGVYTNVNNDQTRTLRNDAEVVGIEGRNFYRSPSVVRDWPCLCFYSASEMTEGKVEDNGAFIYEMAQDYIDSFSDGETFATMLVKPLKERMSMLIIHNVGSFLKRLRDLFEENELEEDKDFYIQPVRYRQGRKAFCCERVPYELLSKEEAFKKQQEYRIILNPYNPKMTKLLQDGHKLHIGPLTDMAVLKTNFYNGAVLKITKEHISVTYDNWRNRIGPLNEWELFSLIRIMPYYHHSASCVMNGEMVSAYRFWHELVLVFCSKYNIELRHGEYIDGKDDYVVLIFHGDSMETIDANEKRDSHWYTRKDTWVAPTFDGSVKSDGKLKVNILVQDECDEKGNVTKFHQVMVVEGDNANN